LSLLKFPADTKGAVSPHDSFPQLETNTPELPAKIAKDYEH
jgi:hypothetical protein